MGMPGCLHPDHEGYFATPAAYLEWYHRAGPLRADPAAPTVAVRCTSGFLSAAKCKDVHVVTDQQPVVNAGWCIASVHACAAGPEVLHWAMVCTTLPSRRQQAMAMRRAAQVLLYRKHVITAQPYIAQLVRCLEAGGVRPVPVFINGVEAHTIVRDQLTTAHERAALRARGGARGDAPQRDAIEVDAIVSTIGFPVRGVLW